VVAGHEDLAPLEAGNMAGEALGLSAHHQVAEDPHLVAVGDRIVPAGDHLFVHGVGVGEGAVAVSDDVVVTEVVVGRVPPAHRSSVPSPMSGTPANFRPQRGRSKTGG